MYQIHSSDQIFILEAPIEGLLEEEAPSHLHRSIGLSGRLQFGFWSVWFVPYLALEGSYIYIYGKNRVGISPPQGGMGICDSPPVQDAGIV